VTVPELSFRPGTLKRDCPRAQLWYKDRVPSFRLLVALVVSVAVILSSPFIRDIRDWIRATFPGQYATVVAAAVALAIAAALVVAVVRIRDRRGARYGAILLALALGTAYALWNAQGIAEVDAVERVHFVEYGLITLLFYRVWRPRGDASMFVLPMLAGIAVGTLEEWLQWFIPGRVGDMRDVFLNGVAIVCGLLFSVGIDPPDGGAFALRPGSLRRIGVVATAVTILFASFVYSVHLGVEIRDAEAGRFRSRYDAATLIGIGQERLVLWKDHPPIERPRSRSREDQYMSEGLLHAQERNRRWEAGDVQAAWSENLILEKYFAPVLDTPSYISRTGHRWPPGQRADAAHRLANAAALQGSYESRADAAEGRHFIRTWSPVVFWMLVVLVVAGILTTCFILDRVKR
jgi:VanZ like family